MGPWPVWLRGPGLGAGRGHFCQICILAEDKGGSGLGTQQHLLPPQEAWEGTQDMESVHHGSAQLLCSLNEWLSLSVPCSSFMKNERDDTLPYLPFWDWRIFSSFMVPTCPLTQGCLSVPFHWGEPPGLL